MVYFFLTINLLFSNSIVLDNTSKLQEYVTRQMDWQSNYDSRLMDSEIWRNDEMRYRSMDFSNNRMTQREKDITRDGIFGEGFKRKFEF